MLNHPTVERLHQLRLPGMARALASQAQSPEIGQLSFELARGIFSTASVARSTSQIGVVWPPR